MTEGAQGIQDISSQSFARGPELVDTLINGNAVHEQPEEATAGGEVQPVEVNRGATYEPSFGCEGLVDEAILLVIFRRASRCLELLFSILAEDSGDGEVDLTEQPLWNQFVCLRA